MFGGFEIAAWALLVTAAITDLIWGKIFNAVTFPFFFGGLIYRLFAGGGEALGIAAFAVLCAFVIYFPLWRLGVLAAGDVKCLLAFAAWSNSHDVIRLGLAAIVVGAVVGLFVLIKEKGIQGALQGISGQLDRKWNADGKMPRGFRMPYGPAFFCAFVLMKIAEMYRWDVI